MDLQIFKNEEFGEVRTLMIENEPWFVGKDVAAALGFNNPRQAISTHVHEDDKGVHILDTLGGNQQVTIVNESGLYSLIFGSKLEKAQEFKRWVTKEVLPQIRKTGGYIPINKEDSDTDILAKAVLIAQNTLAQKEALIAQQQRTISNQNEVISDQNETIKDQIETIQTQDKTLRVQQPLVDFAVHVANTDELISISDMAKLLCDHGINMGQNKLFQWLRDHKYFTKHKVHDGNKKGNKPYQSYINAGYFVVKESTFLLNNGRTSVTLTPYVTGRGQIYLLNKIKESVL